MSKAKDIFTDIYARKVWGDGSGGGSIHSAPYIQFVNKLIEEFKPRTILDIGCGDLIVSSQFNLSGAKYIGWDASTHCGVKNKNLPGMEIHYSKDALIDELPSADLVLCKEVMQHLSNDDVQTLLTRLSKYQIQVYCNAYDDYYSPVKRNDDILTGEFRPLHIGDFAKFNTSTETKLFFGPLNQQYIVEVANS